MRCPCAFIGHRGFVDNLILHVTSVMWLLGDTLVYVMFSEVQPSANMTAELDFGDV